MTDRAKCGIKNCFVIKELKSSRTNDAAEHNLPARAVAEAAKCAFSYRTTRIESIGNASGGRSLHLKVFEKGGFIVRGRRSFNRDSVSYLLRGRHGMRDPPVCLTKGITLANRVSAVVRITSLFAGPRGLMSWEKSVGKQ